MHQRLARIEVHQTSLMVAVVLAIVALVFAIPAAIALAVLGTGDGPSAWLLLLAPVWYLVMGYLITAVFAWGYNRIAGLLGGIEVVWSPPPTPARGGGDLP